MAIMNKMRDSMHLVLYALVGAFLITIVFEWGMNFTGLGSRKNEIGKVNGKSITIKEFEALYKQQLDNYRRQSPTREIDDRAETQLRDQVWEFLVMKILLDEEYQKLGIKVTDKEIVDEIMSDNPPAIVANQFKDSQTGTFNREQFIQALNDPRNKQGWIQLEEYVKRERLGEKLQTILTSSVFATDAEARQKFDAQQMKLAAKYVLLDMSRTKPDSVFYVSDADIKSYFMEHRNEYKQDPTREAKYVFIPTDPSAEDTAALKKELETLKKEFAATTNDSDFVRGNSDLPPVFDKVLSRSTLDADQQKLFFADGVKQGSVVGPILEGNTFKLIKITSVKDGDTTVRASHILLQPTGNTKADTAKTIAEAKALIAKLKKGADFEQLAKEKSKDPGSGAQGGDLNWFGKNRMVKPFEEACFKAKVGEIVGPVQTQFGVHIIKVTARDTREMKGVEMTKKISPGSQTLERQRRAAAEIQFDAETMGFEKAVEKSGFQLRETGIFSRNGFVPIIGYSSSMANWGFKAKLKDISPVLEVKDGFAVMQLTGINDDGYRKYDDALKQELKAKIIKDRKMADLRKLADGLLAKAEGRLERAAAADSGLTIKETGTFQLSSPTIQGIGYDPLFAAALSGLEKDKLSKPLDTNRGVAIAVLTEKTLGSDSDFDAQKDGLRKQILQEKKSQIVQQWTKALKKQAQIEDNRNLFY